MSPWDTRPNRGNASTYRGGGQMGRSGRVDDHRGHQEKDVAQEKNDASTMPTSLASWVIGVLHGNTNEWFMQYLETDIFKTTQNHIKARTGIDIEWLVTACVAIHNGAEYIPKITGDLLEQVKSQATSSITIGDRDSAIQDGIMRYMRAQSTFSSNQGEDNAGENVKLSKPWLKLHGQHDNRDPEGTLTPVRGSLQRFLGYEKTLLMIDRPANPNAPDGFDDSYHEDYTTDQMTVRCFGHSNDPINKLIDFIKKETETSTTLEVYTITGNAGKLTDTRDKRPMSTIDMELKMRDKITQVVSDFFHPGTRLACKASGAPYRLGFLLSGPPGTGKTSLSVAIASHASVPLALINLQGMDDQDLARAFAGLPHHCVVLFEDIDASSADVRERRKKPVDELNAIGNMEDVSDSDDGNNHVISTSCLERAMEQGFLLLREQQDSALAQMREDQEASNQEVIGLLKQYLETNPGLRQAPSRPQNNAHVEPPPPPPKKVTMSGLLNVIDGAASVEGRLLIVTTNHPDALDEALVRPGRCDHRFHIGYATKTSAEQTFNRIFGTDPRKIHKLAAINRLATAFKDQFPTNSEITTASLAFYCGMFYNHPVEAVQHFPRWLEIGDEVFSYTIKALPTVADKGINVAEPYDTTLLALTSKDFLPAKIPHGSLTTAVQDTPKSWWPNPLRLLLGGTRSAQKNLTPPSERMLLTAADRVSTSQEESDGPALKSLYSAFDLAAVSAAAEAASEKSLSEVQLPRPDPQASTAIETSRDLHHEEETDDDDAYDDLLDIMLADYPSSRRAYPSTSSQHNIEDDDAVSPTLRASVKFSPNDGLQLVAPRPLEDLVGTSASSSPTWPSGRTSPTSDVDTKGSLTRSSGHSSRSSMSVSLASPSLRSQHSTSSLDGKQSEPGACQHNDLENAATLTATAPVETEKALHAKSEVASEAAAEHAEPANQISGDTASSTAHVSVAIDDDTDDGEDFFDAVEEHDR